MEKVSRYRYGVSCVDIEKVWRYGEGLSVMGTRLNLTELY